MLSSSRAKKKEFFPIFVTIDQTCINAVFFYFSLFFSKPLMPRCDDDAYAELARGRLWGHRVTGLTSLVTTALNKYRLHANFWLSPP